MNSTPKIIRLGVTDLSFHHATAAVVSLVLEQMGWQVEQHRAPHELNFQRLGKGEIDLLSSAWLPHSHGVYVADVAADVPLRELGLHYQPYAFWGVPEYVPPSQVASITDLLKPQVAAHMQPVIQGIGPGAGITRFSLSAMREYGLEASGLYHFRTGTQAECVAAFEQLVAEQRWGVVPLWHPQFLHHRYRIRELHDPKGLMGGVDRAVLLAREDRLQAFSQAEIQVLDNIRLSNAIVAELDDAICREQHSPQAAARGWLSRHPRLLADWLAPFTLATR